MNPEIKPVWRGIDIEYILGECYLCNPHDERHSFIFILSVNKYTFIPLRLECYIWHYI